MVDKGSELTFTLSANAGYKVKALTIGDATYSDVTDNTITKKVKIEKETAISATLEAEANPTPNGGTFTDTQGNKVTIAHVEHYYGERIGYRLTGDIYIEEINSEAFKAKLDTLNGKELYTDSLNINCFKSNPAQTGTGTYISKEITPEILKGVLELKKARKFSTLKLNNKTSNGPIDINFKSDKSDYFAISDLTKFSFSEGFKLQENSNIFLNEKPDLNMPGTEDHTEYPKVKELLRLINEPIFKNKITVGNVQVAGNVKDLLPYLVPGPNKIKEEDGGIIFGNANIIPCEGELWTGFNGWISESQKESVLKIDELRELCKRTKGHSVYIRNAIIENLNSKDSNQIRDIIFLDSKLANVNFKNSDLSNLEIGAQVQNNLEFENTTLPTNMGNSIVDTLILKNAKLPEELKETDPEDLPYRLPNINDNLKIFNLELLNKWTEADLSKLDKVKLPPKKYVGPENIWNKFKHLYRDEGTKTHFTNEDLTDTPLEDINFSSIQKQQSQLLALLQTQSKSRS